LNLPSLFRSTGHRDFEHGEVVVHSNTGLEQNSRRASVKGHRQLPIWFNLFTVRDKIYIVHFCLSSRWHGTVTVTWTGCSSDRQIALSAATKPTGETSTSRSDRRLVFTNI
jgi:hypothetical protein